MTYGYENLKLEKGMYGQSGRSFLKVLESLDPSENYKGTALEGLDAFQRQLKRFDIHVKGAGSDMVEKFFHTSESSVLFPEFVSRVVRQGMESDILPDITATVTNFDGMDYRSIASVPTDDDKELKRVEEGAGIPTTSIRTQENLVKLHKRGRMLVASYEAIRFQRLDLFSVTLRQIGAYIARMHLKDAIDVLMNGDGNNNAATSYTIGDGGIGGTKGTLSYDALLSFWSQFDPYTMNTMLMGSDMMLAMLKLSEFQNPLTGLNFQGTGTLARLLAALGSTLGTLLAFFGDVIPDLALKLAQLAHLRAELDGAADGEHGVHQIDAEDEGRERHGDGRAEIHDVLPQPGLDKVAQQHARKAEACGVQKAHTAIDLEFIMGVVPPAHVEELFHDPAREVFKDRRDDRTEDEREHRILEAAVQKIQHEQRAMAVNGAEEAVEEASLFADVTLGDGAV